MRYAPPQTLADRAFHAIDVGMQWLYRVFRVRPQSFLDLVTITSPTTLVMRDGTLVTALQIAGATRSVLQQELETILDVSNGKLASYMGDGCHYASFYFSRDKRGIREELERTYGAARRSTKAMGADFSDLIDEQIDVLERMCFSETCLLLLYTTQHGLSKDERDLLQKRHERALEGLPSARGAQPLAPYGEGLQARHDSFVEMYRHDLATAFVEAEVLDAHVFLRFLRTGIDPEWTDPAWRPRLPGDPPPMRVPEDFQGDWSSLLWPTLPEQLFPRGARTEGAYCIIGDRAYAPVTISLMPQSPEPFQTLFARLNREQIPWRMHELIRNDGLDLLAFKEKMASLLLFSGAPENRRLVDVKKALGRLREAGDEIVKLQITLCTWALKDDLGLLEERRARLARCVQGWGNCEVAPVEGDILESTLCSLPGAMLGSVATPAAAPLYDAMKMAPLTRPASAWKSGSQPLRTRDGRLFHYEPYSARQTSWVTLIFGPMGTGKSVWMNYCNLSLILKSDLSELPYISIIDVGPSSRGLVSLVKAALPPERRHLAMYARLTNSTDCAINVFDTPLGLRKPLSVHMAFLVNFLSLLATPDDSASPVEGTEGFVSMLVTHVYDTLASFGNRKPYEPRVSERIDRALKDLDVPDKPGRTWWEVVDLLAERGMTRDALLAQRYAVPTLGDLVEACRDETIMATFGANRVAQTQEDLPSYMFRRLRDAMNRYKILGAVTRFDLGDARIVSLDLDEVARGAGGTGKRAVATMYMLAYQVLTSRFFLTVDHLREIPDAHAFGVDYRAHHAARIDGLARLPKRLCIDEKHRVRGIRVVEEQMDMAIREGRKAKVEIVQASQIAEDFSEDSIKLATSIFILGAGTKANIRPVVERFQLSDAMAYHLEHNMRKPGREGATILCLTQTDAGALEHILVSSQGPTFLWATNTNRDDAYVRDRLARSIGDQAARHFLVKRFPSATLEEEIARRKRALGESGIDSDELDTPTSLLDGLADELLADYKLYSGARPETETVARLVGRSSAALSEDIQGTPS